MTTREQLAEVIRDGVDTWRTPLEAADAILPLIREARAAELEAAADAWWARIRTLGLGTKAPIHWLTARAAAIRAGDK